MILTFKSFYFSGTQYRKKGLRWFSLNILLPLVLIIVCNLTFSHCSVPYLEQQWNVITGYSCIKHALDQIALAVIWIPAGIREGTSLWQVKNAMWQTEKTNANKESMDLREVVDFFMGAPHKHSIWLWISWTTVSPFHCTVFSVGSPAWNWFCKVEYYFFLDAADGIRLWSGLAASQKTNLFYLDFVHTVVWMDFSFWFLLLATPVGLRNLKVCHYWNIFVSGVTFHFSCSQGSAFLPTALHFSSHR